MCSTKYENVKNYVFCVVENYGWYWSRQWPLDRYSDLGMMNFVNYGLIDDFFGFHSFSYELQWVPQFVGDDCARHSEICYYYVCLHIASAYIMTKITLFCEMWKRLLRLRINGICKYAGLFVTSECFIYDTLGLYQTSKIIARANWWKFHQNLPVVFHVILFT